MVVSDALRCGAVFSTAIVEVVDFGATETVEFDLLDCLVEALLVLPVFVLVDEDDFVLPDSERAFLLALILCAFTPARVASTGAAKILMTVAANIAQKKDAFDGLYPSRRGILMEVR